MKGLMSKSVELRGGVVRRGDRVIVNADSYHGRPGTFRGEMPDGRLAVSVNLSKYSQTVLCLTRGEVERKEHRTWWIRSRIR